MHRSQSPPPTRVHDPLPGFRRGVDSLATIKTAAQRRENPTQRVADFFTRLSGSMAFIYFHTVWFLVWMVWNLNLIPGLRAFDPFPFGLLIHVAWFGLWIGLGVERYPYGLLTMIVSLEAIFLSTFVLISQNREQQLSSVRDELQTQISLYQEQELTQVLRIVHRMEKHLGLMEQDERLVRAMEHFVDADDLLREIEAGVGRVS
jgi:uncharacterized membrane protein